MHAGLGSVRGIQISAMEMVLVIMEIVDKVAGFPSIGDSRTANDLFVGGKRGRESRVGRVGLTGLDNERPRRYQGKQVRGIDVFRYIGMKPSPAGMIPMIPDNIQVR